MKFILLTWLGYLIAMAIMAVIGIEKNDAQHSIIIAMGLTTAYYLEKLYNKDKEDE